MSKWINNTPPEPRLKLNATGICSLTVVLFTLAGCSAPPAVSPLLRVTQKAMSQEMQYLQADAERDAAYANQTLRSLDAAFSADLALAAEAQTLSPDWVEDAMAVYVPAREAVVRHREQVAQQRRVRQENLQAAMLAQQRAEQLLEQQSQLITRSTRFDVWKLLALDNPLVLEDE